MVNAQKQLSLKEIQETMHKKERAMRIEFYTLTKLEKDILAKTVKLQEEVGELANDVLAKLQLQRKSKLEAFNKVNMYQEFADIIISTLALANTLDVDVDRAVREKLEKIVAV